MFLVCRDQEDDELLINVVAMGEILDTLAMASTMGLVAVLILVGLLLNSCCSMFS
jgi:hypothetical protein